MENKQTAVQWLVEKLSSQPIENINDEYWFGIIGEAKAMEKEQHKETFKQSRQAKIFEKDMPPVWESAEQYYNETYGK